ncbi:hypothetical protein GCM10009665_68780 [Kitasatospora nipponensis]|uniref:Uncharacterized protein n=1 Tax=Kitasatospora nipponensis TaxID=258049 RepID=A0ABN1WX86_9ACTN
MDQRPTAAELAHPIALALGGNWRPGPVLHGARELTHAATLTHLDGRQLHLSERFDDPDHLHIRGLFPATDYAFRRGETDSIRVATDEAADSIAALISGDFIARQQEVHQRVQEHNGQQAKARQAVEGHARTVAALLPGARTRIEGTTAYLHIDLDPGSVRIGIDSDTVNIVLSDAPPIIADAVVYAVSRFLPHIETPEEEFGHLDEEFDL